MILQFPQSATRTTPPVPRAASTGSGVVPFCTIAGPDGIGRALADRRAAGRKRWAERVFSDADNQPYTSLQAATRILLRDTPFYALPRHIRVAIVELALST